MKLNWADEHFAEDHPDLVYHYTDAAGLLGILQSGSIWATNVRFLNDTKEGELPFEMGLDELRRAYKKIPEPTEEMGMHLITEEHFGGGKATYLASFSSVHDSLSQWRGYGGSSQGYTVAFEREKLIAHAETVGWKLRQCEYDDGSLQMHVAHVVEEGLRTVDGYPKNNYELNAVSNRISRGLGQFAGHWKHKAFEEEREWRLIGFDANEPGSHKVKFRRGAHGVVPYVEVPLPTRPFADWQVLAGDLESLGQLSVAAIGIGPGWTGDKVLAIEMLCQQARVHVDIGIYKSTAPYLPT